MVKAIRKGGFTQDRASLVDVFCWYRGLRHAHISGILDAGLTAKGDLFFVREFAPPTELFNTRDAELLNVLLGTVDFLHSTGRVHGSIKPSNVLAASKSLQLADPWIPQAWRGPSSEEEVRFSAPEVLKGGSRTIESDLYSVGALLYRFFSGRDLFDDADLESLSARHIWASPRPLTSISYVSRTLADIVENLIHKDPTQRRPAFEALRNELRLQSVAADRSPAFGLTRQLKKAETFLTANVDRLRVLVVEAAVGFGKTRYIEELRHRIALRVPHVAVSVCPTTGRSPEVTVAQWLLSAFERHSSAFDNPSVRRLQAFVDDDLESQPDYSRELIFHDLVDVLALITQKTPLVLVVEDVDRANKRVGRLITSIVSRTTRLPICLVITSRPGGIAPKMLQAFKDYVGPALEHITLGHLADEDAESIASFMERDDERRTTACKESGGNPLFLEAYCKNRKTGVPSLVRSTISKLVAALPKQTRQVAEVLSVFEKPATLDVLRQISGIGEAELERHLTCLSHIGLAGNSVAICHSDTRTFLYSRISKKRRTALHVLCYKHLKDSGIDTNTLAWHAYHGSLFEVAGSLYLELASFAFHSQLFKSAASSYTLLDKCREQSSTVPPAGVEELVSFAKCRAYLGDRSSARNTLRHLLPTQKVQENPEFLSSIYSALASQFIEFSNAERVRLLELAIASLNPDSPTLAFRYGSLANAFLCLGEFDSADKALDKALAYQSEGVDATRALDMRTFIMMNRGKFKEAANAFSHKAFEWAIPLLVTVTLAVCLEHMGSLREARQIYIDALREAKSQGAYLEAQCLANLASVESKLGKATTAQNLFDSAIVKFERIQHRELAGYLPNAACYSDAALHSISIGSYPRALQFVRQLNPSLDRGSRVETFQFLLTRGELYASLGNFTAAAAILDRTHEFASCGQFFAIERLLLRTRFHDPSSTLCNELREAAQSSLRLEMRYQQCRVLIALAQRLLLHGDDLGSRSASTQALDLASENGYRMLAAQALLQRGLAAESDGLKQSYLMRCLQEASNMGLYPLLSECTFRIGAWRACYGDHSAARDYLFKSVSLTARLAEDLSLADRKRFLSLQPHKEARRLLEDATARTREFHSVLREPLGKGDLAFGGLYRLTSSIMSDPDFPSTVSTLIHSIKECVQQPGVVVLAKGNDIALYPLNENSSEDMRLRARNAFGRTETRTYFTNLGKQEQGSAVWVPIPGLSIRGGIYIECPGFATLDEQELQFLTVSAALVAAALDQRVVKQSREMMDPPQEFSGIVGTSQPMRKVYVDIEVAARNSATVLIEGESGTGKELVAKAIHSRSLRRTAPFVPLDCGALPDTLIEAELFGTKKGAFTGATEDRRGLFEEAEHGTIFLDEISNASLLLQTKLLRVLQDKEIRRLGDTKRRRIDVRLIAATNCSLEVLVAEGRFRQDLLFRLKVLHIQLPPLRDRKGDIPLLANAFLNRLNALSHKRKIFAERTLGSLLLHEYPGNIRELHNAIEQSFYRCEGDLIEELGLRKAGLASPRDATDETQGLFRELTEGRRSFWSVVRERYKRRDISRELVLALVDLGLRATHGNYKAMASMFRIKDTDYRRLMDFLRRNDCLLDFRPYRKIELNP